MRLGKRERRLRREAKAAAAARRMRILRDGAPVPIRLGCHKFTPFRMVFTPVGLRSQAWRDDWRRKAASVVTITP